jgi:purine-binding chemotaxis protein CheW
MAERNDLRTASDVQRFLTFKVAGRLYALPAEAVREIVLPSPMAKVPLAPKPLLGFANLRGVVLPVASLRLLLGRDAEGAGSASQRVIVLEGRPAFGLLVDEVAALSPIQAGDIAAEQAQISADDGEIVLGAFKIEGANDIARILDIQTLLTRALGVDTRRSQSVAPVLQRQGRATAAAARQLETFITFEVAGQEFGLPLDSVREVLPSADVTAPLPRAETAVLGLTALRTMLLPLLSMRALLGFAPDAGRRMTLVASISGVSVGLAVDAVRDIVRADESELEPVPAAIASRSQGEASVQSVLKIDGGARLIAILAPNKLFREDVMNRIKASATASAPAAPASANGTERIFLVFTLGGQEFGLAISAVEEVARLPEEITRLPKAPDFLKGVVNLRGTVLPIIDQRRRFDFAASDDDAGRRLVVVRIGATVAGFIVDSVSEVLRIGSQAIDPPPDVIVPARVLEGVINLEADGRMVLLLDPTQLLSRTEQGLLDALSRVQEAQAAVDQGTDR